MTLEETIDLLVLAGAFDRRNIGESDTVAWHAALGDIPFADAQIAVIDHYREHREFIMPADVWQRVKAMRRDRIARAVLNAPEPELTEAPGRYMAAITEMVRRVGDGFGGRRAIAEPVRQGPPPQEFTEALAALPRPADKREAARRQADESRAARELAEREEAGNA
jgi:hypothetical protein